MCFHLNQEIMRDLEDAGWKKAAEKRRADVTELDIIVNIIEYLE